jgi:mono/diheme cytochrome c family protein
MRRLGVVLAVFLWTAACSTETGPPPQPDLEAGRETYGRLCSVCHGGQGEGGVGPDLSSVVGTFPDCETQIRWITLGAEKWVTEVGPTYGTQGKSITGTMPSFERTLTEAQIRQVAAFERFRYGGSGEAEAIADCDLG